MKKTKQKTIGVNPLEQYITAKPEPKEVSQEAPSLMRELPAHEFGPRQRITMQIDAALVDRVKNAVFWEPGLTLAALCEMALYKAVEDMEKERGSVYPPRKAHYLKGGRPLA